MESFNLEYYRAFYTVAQTGNVTKAAEAAVPVPARRNPLHPPAGGVSWLQVVYPRFPRRAAHRGRHGAFSHVDSAFKSLSNGERELKRLAAFEAGTPIIGAAETPLYHFLLPKLGQFREMHPNVTLQVQGSSTHETIQMLRAEQADVVLAVSPLTDVEDLSVTELASFRDVFVAGPRFKSLAIGILPSLFAQSLLTQEGFFALDTEPIPARQILLVHRGEGRTSLLFILTSSKRKKPCHIKALQMRRTPLFDKNVRKTEFISLPQPHHTLHQQTDGGDARPAAGSQQQRFSPALYQLDHVAVQSDSRHSHDDEELAQLLQRLKHR